MNGIIKFLFSGVAVFVTAYLLQKGVHVTNFGYALLVAAVLSVVNVIIKPIFIVLTIPLTLVSLGLFLIVINAAMILIVDYFVPDFSVDGFWWALAFSIILSIFNSLFGDLIKDRKES